MKKHITFSNLLLFLLTITVLWLVNEKTNINYDGTVYIPNQDGRFMLIKTDYGGFPIHIDKTKTVDDRTELNLILINPFIIHFGGAVISAHVDGTIETERMNLVPGVNNLKFKIPPIERGDIIEITLELNKVYFK